MAADCQNKKMKKKAMNFTLSESESDSEKLTQVVRRITGHSRVL